MLTCQPESFIATVGELRELVAGHWEKLALNKDDIPLAPQWEIYFAREELGELLFMPLRDRGRMVGYWIAFIAPGLHYKTCLTAQMDIWNVLPEYERTRAPLVLMKAVEAEYIRRGVQRSFAGEKLHRPCGKLYLKFGYEPVETHYSKMFGDK